MYKSQKPAEFRKECKMYCPLKFHNNLPQVPCEQKLMAFPFDSERFVRYSLTSLEAQHTPPLLLPLDLGVAVDLINADIYEPCPSADLSPDDSDLLQEPLKAKAQHKATRDYTNTSGYLRKSTLPAGPISYSAPAEVSVKTEPDVEAEFDAGTLVPKIVDSFDKAQFVHPTKPHLKPAKVFSVLPEEHQICTEFLLMVFDENPDDEERKNLLKAFDDDEDTQLLSLYAEKEPSDGEEEEGNEYRFLRNYKYSYLHDPNLNDIVLWLDEEKMVANYCVVENKLQLKKKPMPKNQNSASMPERKIRVSFRPEKKSELVVRKDKLLEMGFQAEEGMETPVLAAMEDDMYDDNMEDNNLMKKLFGSDDESQDE
jgi:hypothetical protein